MARAAPAIAAALICALGASPAAARALWEPLPGRTLVALMKPMPELKRSQLWNRRPPGAIVEYTILWQPGAGSGWAADALARLDRFAERYPESALILGVNMVGHAAAVARGELDAEVDEIIRRVQRHRRPAYLRLGYEFDGPWNRYAPAEYVAAWAHFRQRMGVLGATGIALVWHSAAYCGPTFENRRIEDWYPGDDQVDWVGMSYFDASECGGLVAEGLVHFARRHRKPVMIAEATPRGYDLAELRRSADGVTFRSHHSSDIWSDWFAPLFRFVEQNADVVRILTYIDQDWDAQPMWKAPPGSTYWGDTRLEASEGILLRWREATAGGRWLWGGAELFQTLGHEDPDVDSSKNEVSAPGPGR